MSEKRSILIASSDSAEAERLGHDLAAGQPDWTVVFDNSAGAAIERLSQSPFDVVIADLDLPDLNGADFLDEVWKSQPKTVRFLRAQTVDNDLMMKCIWGTHRYAAKGQDGPSLQSAVLRALELDCWVSNTSIKSLVSRIRTFPTIPSLYFKVLREAESPNASAAAVAEIIGQDMAMSTKVMKVVNSAFYGLSRQITDLKEAVSIMGLETVKALVLAIYTFAQLDKVKPVYFSIDKIWRHGVTVGQMARQIVLVETGDMEMAEEAYTAGLLHDIGKIILASNLGELYTGAINLARKRTIPLIEVESEIFGASHAETAAYLLAMWGLPAGIVEATALHHCPGKGRKEFTALTAVHVANVFANEAESEKSEFVPTALDEAYLEELGLANRINQWRAALGGPNQKATASAPKKTADKPAPGAALPASIPARKINLTAGGGRGRKSRFAIPLAFAACALVLGATGWMLVSFLNSATESPESASAAPKVKAVAATATATATNTAAAPQPAPAPPVSTEPAPEKAPVQIASAPESAPTAVVQEQKPEPVRETPAFPRSSELAQPRTKAFPAMALQGILYRSTNSVALLNGQRLRLGSQIDGVQVVGIERDRVRLQYDGQERILEVGKKF